MAEVPKEPNVLFIDESTGKVFYTDHNSLSSSNESNNMEEDTFQPTLLHSFETRVLSILEENFQGITFQNANEQGKQLIRTFGPNMEPVWYKPLVQQINIPNTLISLIVHTALRIFPNTSTVQPPPFLSILDAKPNKSKKAAPKSIEKVYVNQIILDNKKNNIRDIFIYDVPAGWFHAKIIAKLKA
ncbi:hypothetical protein RCL_jg6899.t1 [Rhizophagus clarus]|uniref:Uncharacterized protein n=1 Tax=Rhizophagus clarus TaxID=94130 RepID=A0A8H3LEH6_9GLOM|nr:hypothetical protein RCL_jg6899.t1 [Rhizophagus clarus]